MKQGRITGVPADVAAALEKIREANGGEMPVDACLEAARDEKSPLHRYVTWDVKKAAKEHQRAQMRALLGRVQIVYYTEPTIKVSVPAYVSPPNQRRTVTGGLYRSIFDLAKPEEEPQAASILCEIASIIETAVRRLRNLGAAMNVSDLAETLESVALQLRERAAAAPKGPEADDEDRPRT